MPARVRSPRRDAVVAVMWILAYGALVGLPLLVLLLGSPPRGLGFWWDLSMGLGFAGFGVMAAQFGLTARFRRVGAPFGIDIIYYFHRWIAFGGLILLAAHWGALRLVAPEALAPVLPHEAPGYMTAGRGALALFAVIVITSAWRKPLRLEYDRWRILHGAMAVAALVLATWHIVGAGYYTSAPWTRGVLVGFTVLWLGLLLWVRLVKPWGLLGRPWRVSDVHPEPGRSWTLTLRPEGHPGIRFEPGQFAWLSLERSPFRAREHPFSIAGSAEDGGGLEFTIKELGDFTRTIGRTPVGATAWIDGPHGAFTVDRHPDAPAFGFVAGGVGIAPIMSMLRTLDDRGDARPLRLLYANDRWDEALFRDELAELAGRLDLETTHVLRLPPEGWDGAAGLLTPELVGRWMASGPEGMEYFLCGPKPMSDLVERALRARGVSIRRIHWELFDMA